MLSPVLLLNPKIPPHYLCSQKTSLGQNAWTNRIQSNIITHNKLQSSYPSYLRQQFTIQPPRSTRSSYTLTLLRPSVTSSLKSRYIAIAVPRFETNSWQYCNKYLTHPTNELKSLPLPSLLSSFTPNWKHCYLANLILTHPLRHTSIPSGLNPKHHTP